MTPYISLSLGRSVVKSAKILLNSDCVIIDCTWCCLAWMLCWLYNGYNTDHTWPIRWWCLWCRCPCQWSGRWSHGNCQPKPNMCNHGQPLYPGFTEECKSAAKQLNKDFILMTWIDEEISFPSYPNHYNVIISKHCINCVVVAYAKMLQAYMWGLD